MERYVDPKIEYKPFEEHQAESRWQTCNCQTCQEKRAMLEGIRGEPLPWQTKI